MKLILAALTIYTNASFANDHILSSQILNPIAKPAIGRVYYLERQSKFNDSKCYVESVMKVTKTEDEDDEIHEQQMFVFTTTNGARGATTDFYVTYPTNLDAYADTSAVYKMKLVPNLAIPPVADNKTMLYDRSKYDKVNPKNWIFKVYQANENTKVQKTEVVVAAAEEKTPSAESPARTEPYVSKIEGLKEKIEKCIADRVERARNGGGGGGANPTPKKDEEKENIRTTFVDYNGTTHSSGRATATAEKELEEMVTFFNNNVKIFSAYKEGLKSILVKKMTAPFANYFKSKEEGKKLLKERTALLDTYSKKAVTTQLYALDLAISGDEAIIDSIGGSSLFIYDDNDSKVASSASMIVKERLLKEVKSTLSEITEKNKKVESKLKSCNDGYVTALQIAIDGCNRIIKTEICEEDGSCTIEEKKSPVPNSCEVAADLEKVVEQELKKYSDKIAQKEPNSSRPLGENYLKWHNVIVEMAKNAQKFSGKEYDWGSPLKVCVAKDFETTLLEEGLILGKNTASESFAKYDGLVGYGNLQVELLKQLSEKINNSLAYDQSQLDKLLKQRQERIDHYKQAQEAYKKDKK